MIRRPPRSTPSNSSAASDVYKRQIYDKEKVLDAMVEMVLSAEQALAEGDVNQIGKMLDCLLYTSPSPRDRG